MPSTGRSFCPEFPRSGALPITWLAFGYSPSWKIPLPLLRESSASSELVARHSSFCCGKMGQARSQPYCAARLLAPRAADADLEAADLFAETLFACREKAALETVDLGSRFSAPSVLRERLAEGILHGCSCPSLYSRSARSRTVFDPLFGGCSGMPALRALLRPIAIACLADRAPCLPSRTCSISSCTNSPAAVDRALPSRMSCLARCSVSFSGMVVLLSAAHCGTS
jgi:hypothetical protein